MKKTARKIISVLLAVVMVLSIVPMVGVSSFAVTSGDYEYSVVSKEDKTCSITDYKGSATEVKVPSEIDGYTVTGISGGAFRACTTLTSIIIPDDVTSIGNGAFRNCSSLISITIPNSVTSIGKDLFFACRSLKEAYIGSNCAVSVFERNTKLEKVILGEGVTDIPDYAFYDCTSLTSVTLPDSLTSIGQDAFYNTAITSINIPDGVTSIGQNAFIWCGSLTSINVGKNNKNYLSVDGVLFNKDKTELIAYPAGSTRTSYIIPDSVTSIGSAIFANCTSLTGVTIPNSVTSIGDYAFEGCTSLTSVNIPDSVTSVDFCAFNDCTSLTSVTIPDSVTDIVSFAFGYYEDEIDYEDKKVEGFTIYGYTGSAAETYAKDNEFTFIALESLSADYTEYNKAVEQADALDRSQYTDESIAALDNALAVDVSGKDITEQSLVDVQTKAILDAINGLKTKTVSMYRLYNPNSGEHFYTADVNEKDWLISEGWQDEGIGWYAPKSSSTPVYRLYNQYGGEHHYTTDINEKNTLISIGWTDEGIGWYSDDAQSVAIYRQYNPNAVANNHNFTANKAENDWLVGLGWQYEGIGWYGVA